MQDTGRKDLQRRNILFGWLNGLLLQHCQVPSVRSWELRKGTLMHPRRRFVAARGTLGISPEIRIDSGRGDPPLLDKRRTGTIIPAIPKGLGFSTPSRSAFPRQRRNLLPAHAPRIRPITERIRHQSPPSFLLRRCAAVCSPVCVRKRHSTPREMSGNQGPRAEGQGSHCALPNMTP